MNRIVEAVPKVVHRAMARRAATIAIRNSGETTSPPRHIEGERIYFAAAMMIERFVDVDQSASQIFWDVHRESSGSFVRTLQAQSSGDIQPSS